MRRQNDAGRTWASRSATITSPINLALREQIAPTGILRVGVMTGPYPSPFLVTLDELSGDPVGVAVILACAVSCSLSVPLKFVFHRRLTELDEGARTGSYDLAFLPVTPERKAVLEFGPAYFRFSNAMLVKASSQLQHIRDVDRARVIIAVQAASLHHRHLEAKLQFASLQVYDSLDELSQRLAAGDVDVLAHATPVLTSLARRVQDARLLDGILSTSSVAVAVPRGRSRALRFVREFTSTALTTGRIAQAFSQAGLQPDGST